MDSQVMNRKPTPKDWKKIEEKLKSFYNLVKLKCDGYEITLKLERLSTYKNGISVYIDGMFKGEWIMNDCEERRRFYRPVVKSLLSKKEMDMYKKKYKKKKEREELESRSKYTAHYHYWTSFRSLKKHLIENNEVIEIICDEVQ